MTYGQSVMAEMYKAADGIRNRTLEQKAIGVKVWHQALKWLEEGKLDPPPLELREGLEGALKGVDDLRKGLVSGRKIVSRLV